MTNHVQAAHLEAGYSATAEANRPSETQDRSNTGMSAHERPLAVALKFELEFELRSESGTSRPVNLETRAWPPSPKRKAPLLHADTLARTLHQDGA